MVFNTIEDAYKKKAKGMAKYALPRLYRKEDCDDVVHDAFVKALVYQDKYKNRKVLISSFILDLELARAIRRANRSSAEVPGGLMGESNEVHEEG